MCDFGRCKHGGNEPYSNMKKIRNSAAYCRVIYQLIVGHYYDVDYLFDIDVWYSFIIGLMIVVMKICEHVPELLFFFT